MNVGRIVSLVLLLFVFVFGLSTFFGSWYTIDEGERGVVLRNGSFTKVATPGLGFKLPFIDTVYEFSLREVTTTPGYDAGYAISESNNGVESYSQDQQESHIILAIQWSIPADQVEKVYAEYGSAQALVQRAIVPRAVAAVKVVYGQYNAINAVQQRGKLNGEASEAVKRALVGVPIQVSSVSIPNIQLPPGYIQKINERMAAEAEVQTMKQNAEKAVQQARKTVTEAQATADSNLAVAKAEAESVRIKGEAEASAISAKAKALAENAALVEYTKALKWKGDVPQTFSMVPGNAVPLMMLGNSNQPALTPPK
jgi:regulator of protease activity HflC (stomatin/prohibitin superfamily)